MTTRVDGPGDGAGPYESVDAGDTVWRFDRAFLASNWACIWGRGCQGIGVHPDPAAGLGCCSVGAELTDIDEARRLAALAATLGPGEVEYHAAAATGGIFADDARTATRVVDGACIFLNRPGFPGGTGCALHLAALAAGESPIDWKPSVCWQLPIRVDWEAGPGGVEVATVRRWTRADWGDEGETMAWCCTEEPEAYVGDQPVIDSLGETLSVIAGTEVLAELRRRLEASPEPPR